MFLKSGRCVRNLQPTSTLTSARYSETCERSRSRWDRGWFDGREGQGPNKPPYLTGTAIRSIRAGEPSLVRHAAGAMRTRCWRNCRSAPETRSRRQDQSYPAGQARRGDPSGVRAPSPGTGHAGQGPAAVCDLPAMPPPGRLDRPQEYMKSPRSRKTTTVRSPNGHGWWVPPTP